VESTGSLSSPQWGLVAGVPEATNEFTRLRVPSTGSSSFFRLVHVP
jgi:hypothetical protein